MFDLGFSEMLLTGVVALVVLGPERLPKVARAAGLWLGRLQRFVSGVKNELSRQMDAEGLSEVKEDFQAAVREAQEGWRDARHALQNQAQGIDPELPAWERLPPQRTPAGRARCFWNGLRLCSRRFRIRFAHFFSSFRVMI